MITAREALEKSIEEKNKEKERKNSLFKGIEKLIEKKITQAVKNGEGSTCVSYESHNKDLMFANIPVQYISDLQNQGYTVSEYTHWGHGLHISWSL